MEPEQKKPIKPSDSSKQQDRKFEFDTDIRVGENYGQVKGVHIEKLIIQQQGEDASRKPAVEVNMIFGTTEGSFEEIQQAKIEDNPMIIFFLSNKSRLLQKLRGPFTLNAQDEEVLLFPGDWIELDYGGFQQIGTKNLDLLERYRSLWFENPEGYKFFVPEDVYQRVKQEILEFRDAVCQRIV